MNTNNRHTLRFITGPIVICLMMLGIAPSAHAADETLICGGLTVTGPDNTHTCDEVMDVLFINSTPYAESVTQVVSMTDANETATTTSLYVNTPAPGATTTVVLDNLNIRRDQTGFSPLLVSLTSPGQVQFLLRGDTVLDARSESGTGSSAGLAVINPGTPPIIDTESNDPVGTLTGYGDEGAGIGGNGQAAFYGINIQGGIVTGISKTGSGVGAGWPGTSAPVQVIVSGDDLLHPTIVRGTTEEPQGMPYLSDIASGTASPDGTGNQYNVAYWQDTDTTGPWTALSKDLSFAEMMNPASPRPNMIAVPAWEGNVTYDIGSGTWASGQPEVSSFTNLNEVVVDTAPTPPLGYTFDGWKLSNDDLGTEDPELFQEIAFPHGEGDSFTLTAVYAPIQYSITYDLAGGTWSEGFSPTETFTVEDSVNITEIPTRPGNTFLGWTVNHEETTPVKEFSISPGSTGNYLLVANWAENSTTTTKPSAATAPSSLAKTGASGGPILLVAATSGIGIALLLTLNIGKVLRRRS